MLPMLDKPADSVVCTSHRNMVEKMADSAFWHVQTPEQPRHTFHIPMQQTTRQVQADFCTC